MLKVGGENVAASEIERVVYTVPGVQEVAVVGKPDPIRQEIPIAFVVTKGDFIEDNQALKRKILSACQRELADFKIPKAVHFLEDFPRSVLHKIAKAKLREKLAKED